MSRTLLILRPQPGADATAARARELGLEPVVAPLFQVRPLEWRVPDAGTFDAVMLTSANAARHAGAGLASFLHLPCYCVGGATACTARAAGFRDLRTGASDGGALLRDMAGDGVRRAFHPRGRDSVPLALPGVEIVFRAVYAADAVDALPVEAAAALAGGALALIHSPRAGALLARLAPGRSDVAIAAISDAAAAACGTGWRSIAVAERPRDEALLELAAKLCNSGHGQGWRSE